MLSSLLAVKRWLVLPSLICLMLSNTLLAAQRIVVLAPDLVENVFAIGAGDRIVGRISGANYPEEILNVPIVGDHQLLNYEAILSLAPDIVLAWKGGNPERQLQHLESLGLSVERIETSRLSDLPKQFRFLGDLLDRQKTGESLATEFELRRQELKADSDRPKLSVFYELWHDPLLTVNQSSWINDLLEQCGAVNPFSASIEAVPQVSFEAVLSEEVDLIIGGNELPKNWRNKWYEWVNIPAVAENRLYTVNSDHLHRLTSRTLIAMEEVCQLIAGVPLVHGVN